MDWLKKHYDAAILILLSLLVVALAVGFFLSAANFSQAFAERNSTKAPDHSIPAPPVEPIQQALKSMADLVAWAGHEGSLFVSRIYILKDGALFDPIDGDEPLHPPVENSWLLKYDLDYSRTDILETDPDGDGFTVLEEWKAKTDPSDPKSTPPLVSKLRLESTNRIPFKVKFSGSPDGGETFTINFIDNPSEPTRFLSRGDTVKIAEQTYTVTGYEAKSTTVNDFTRDVSELTLENKATGEKMILVNNQIMDSPTSFATLKNLITGSSTEVKKGDSFQIEGVSEPFQLVEVGENQATIRDTKTGETFVIEP